MELQVASITLTANVETLIEFLVTSLAGIAAVGTFAMSIVQACKALPIRRWYFQFHLRHFLGEQEQPNVHALEKLIIEYSAGGKREFYTQDLPAIAQNLGAIKNLALAWPASPKFKSFLETFDPGTVKILTNSPPPPNSEELTAYLNQLIGARIDAFNIRVKRRWTIYQQGAAMVLSMALILALVQFENLWAMLIYSILGGLMAPFTHDIIKKIKPS